MSTWHDTPPTKAGTYWVKSGEEDVIGCFDPAEPEQWVIEDDSLSTNCLVRRGYQFGPRIPTADELAELPGLVEEYGTACHLLGKLASGSSSGRFHQRKACDRMRAKINAILGVADDAGAD